MENKKINILLLILLVSLYNGRVNAQNNTLKVGTNPTIKEASTVMEIESTNKGLLMPRVALTGILDITTISNAANALIIYNTATAGTAPNEVTPGFYYWKKDIVVPANNKWMRVFDSGTQHEPWNVQGSTSQATANSQNIYQNGTVAIGAATIPTFIVGGATIAPKFHVAGDISTTGKLWTTNSVYADYVFEKYYDGCSKINEDYNFKSLAEVAEFIKANRHLPGVTPISEISENEKGYTIDLTQLSMQQLEKLEELYLHTIEQQLRINQQQLEIDQMKIVLERLEKSLTAPKNKK